MEKQTHPTLTKIDHPSVWTAEDVLASSAWLRVLTDDENEEIERAVEQVTRSGLALNDVSKNTFALPTLGPCLLEMRRELLHGRGFLQIRGLAHDRLGAHGTGIAFWGLGRHLGDEFASQNAKGHLLGHVRDLGESRANVSQRGPYSRETIPYHVDACDIVGLLCLHPARRGGESSVVSSGHLYNLLLDEDPSYAAALFEPVFRDRRDEIPPGKEPWYAIPVFNYFGELLSCTIEPTYIGSVARHFDGVNPHSQLQLDAVERMQQLANKARFDIAFEAGDIQLVHNHVIMHSRQAFEDFEEPDRKRHLLRLWMLNDDGRPLPDAYYERHGTRQTVRRPGGIVGPNTITSASLSG